MIDGKNIIKKIYKIERLLKEIKKELKSSQENSINEDNIIEFQKDDLIKDYDNLYNEFLLNGNESISQFVKNHTKKYLKFFCKFNNLTISSKASKDEIIRHIIQWFKQRKAITQNINGGK